MFVSCARKGRNHDCCALINSVLTTSLRRFEFAAANRIASRDTERLLSALRIASMASVSTLWNLGALACVDETASRGAPGRFVNLANLTGCNHCTTMGAIPVIQRFSNCRVRINAKDHPPPHFHAQLHDGREAWVRIDPIEIIHGRVATREIAEVLGWAQVRQAWLAQTFEELQR